MSEEEPYFYPNIRPAALMCKIMGSFPLKNSNRSDGRHLLYHWISLDSLWGPIINISCLIIHDIFTSVPSWIMIIPLTTARAMTSVTLCYIYDRKLPDLIKTLEEFERCYCLLTGKSPTKPLYSNAIIWAVGWLLFELTSVSGLISMLLTDPRRTFMRNCLETVVQCHWIQIHSFMLMYLLFCVNISSRFLDLSSYLQTLTKRRLIKDPQRSRKTPEEYILLESLEKIWALYVNLSDATDILNRCYGTRLVLFLGTNFVDSMLDFLQFHTGLGMTGQAELAYVFNNVSLILLVGWLSENISNSVSILELIYISNVILCYWKNTDLLS